MKIVVITGISGSGKTTALRALEDVGYYAIDNLPIQLLDKLAELTARGEIEKVALGIDARAKSGFEQLSSMLESAKGLGYESKIIFLDADDAAIERRFSETRRRHPLSEDGSVADGLARERAMLEPVRRMAHRTVNTTELSVHDLKREMQSSYTEGDESGLSIIVSSFGFRHGVPTHADLVFDVRFLPNPYFDKALRPLCGLDKPVSDYVLEREATQKFLEKLYDLLEFLLPAYTHEGKAYLNIAIGCTGGQHRSVALSAELGRWLDEHDYETTVRHRDVTPRKGSWTPPPGK